MQELFNLNQVRDSEYDYYKNISIACSGLLGGLPRKHQENGLKVVRNLKESLWRRTEFSFQRLRFPRRRRAYQRLLQCMCRWFRCLALFIIFKSFFFFDIKQFCSCTWNGFDGCYWYEFFRNLETHLRKRVQKWVMQESLLTIYELKWKEQDWASQQASEPLMLRGDITRKRGIVNVRWDVYRLEWWRRTTERVVRKWWQKMTNLNA